MTYCPKCKGSFAIIEGAQTATFYGRGVALEGMRTACGAVLIATQFTDTVDYSAGKIGRSENRVPSQYATTCQPEEDGQSFKSPPHSNMVNEEITEEHFYSLLDQDGNPATGYLYDLHSGQGLVAKGATYNTGHTMKVDGNNGSRLVYWLAKDGGERS